MEWYGREVRRQLNERGKVNLKRVEGEKHDSDIDDSEVDESDVTVR